MINPDFHMTIYISEEVFKIVCGAIVCAVGIWGTVKMTDILFGKRDNNTTTAKDTND